MSSCRKNLQSCILKVCAKTIDHNLQFQSMYPILAAAQANQICYPAKIIAEGISARQLIRDAFLRCAYVRTCQRVRP